MYRVQKLKIKSRFTNNFDIFSPVELIRNPLAVLSTFLVYGETLRSRWIKQESDVRDIERFTYNQKKRKSIVIQMYFKP